jgi:hypothetical protein
MVGGPRLFATVATASSYQSASDHRVHFGLGAETQIAQLKVRWPSGIVQVLEDITANQVLEVVEQDESAK